MIRETLKWTTKPVRETGKVYLRKMLKKEYDVQTYEPNERCVEYRFVFEAITTTAPETVLDIGTGKTALPHLMQSCGLKVTATDNIYDYWSKYGMFNRHFYVIDDDITKSRLTQTFDMVTCISTLEHIADFESAVENMARLLKPGGHLVLTCPYTENMYVDNVYKRLGSSVNSEVTYICQSFSRANLDTWLSRNRMKIVQQEYWQCFDGDLWSVGKAINPPRKVSKEQKHQLTCLLIQKGTAPFIPFEKEEQKGDR